MGSPPLSVPDPTCKWVVEKISGSFLVSEVSGSLDSSLGLLYTGARSTYLRFRVKGVYSLPSYQGWTVPTTLLQ